MYGAPRASADSPATMSLVKYGLPRVWPMDVVHERLVRGPPELRFDLRHRPVPVERPELDSVVRGMRRTSASQR